MQLDYEIQTQAGIINTQYGKITFLIKSCPVYVTHRQPEHFFKLHQSFGISETEVEIMRRHHVRKIRIIYHKKGKVKIYEINYANFAKLKTYDNNGDIQIMIPKSELTLKAEGVE